MEDQIRDILSTASFADADARIACEEKLRSLIGERDRALTNEYIAKSNRDEMIPEFKHLFARAEAAEARAAEYERALNEIARANPVDLARDFNWPVRFARAPSHAREKGDEVRLSCSCLCRSGWLEHSAHTTPAIAAFFVLCRSRDIRCSLPDIFGSFRISEDRAMTEQKPVQAQEAYMVANAEGQIWYGAPEMEKEDAERACTDANRHGIGRAPHRVIRVVITPKE